MLKKLDRAHRLYGPGCAEAKLLALQALEHRPLRSPRELLRLHEILCFLRAYPDDATLLDLVEHMLGAFEARSDLRRHRAALADSGMAGTTIHERLFWPAARWVLRRWPDRLFLDWEDAERARLVRQALPLLFDGAVAETLRQDRWSAEDCLDRLRGRDETDAACFLRRIEALPGDDFTHEAFHDGIDAAYRIDPGPDGPSWTRARLARSPVVFRSEAPSRSLPDLRLELRRAPERIRQLSSAEGRELIDLAREAMITRSRDLEAFSFGDPAAVWLVDDGEGLQFAVIGVVPERRFLLHAIHGYLMLRSGVPIGYVQSDSLFGSASVSYNTFETFRGGEAALVFGRVLALTREMFGAESFSVEPYQLGVGNAEGLASGAFWFYYKLGFRPQSPRVLRVLAREVEARKRNPRHRSSEPTLLALASAHLFFEPSGRRSRVPPPPWNVGWHVARELADRGGDDPERAARECSRETAELLGLRSTALGRFTPGERLAWERFSPLVLALPGLPRLDRARRSALVRIIRSKGGRDEREFLRLFNEDPYLGPAILGLAETRR